MSVRRYACLVLALSAGCVVESPDVSRVPVLPEGTPCAAGDLIARTNGGWACVSPTSGPRGPTGPTGPPGPEGPTGLAGNRVAKPFIDAKLELDGVVDLAPSGFGETQYRSLHDPRMILVPGQGSAEVSLACAPPTVGTSTTCRPALATLGVRFPAVAGAYHACASLSVALGIVGGTNVPRATAELHLKLVETPESAEDVLQAGAAETVLEYSAPPDPSNGSGMTIPVHLCGIFSFERPANRTIRILYLLLVSGIEQAGAQLHDGPRPQDVRWEIYPL